jgi:hypothetical protein
VALPVFKTGLAGITLAGRFDSFPPPPITAWLTFATVSPSLRLASPSRRGPSPKNRAGG